MGPSRRRRVALTAIPLDAVPTVVTSTKTLRYEAYGKAAGDGAPPTRAACSATAGLDVRFSMCGAIWSRRRLTGPDDSVLRVPVLPAALLLRDAAADNARLWLSRLPDAGLGL